MTQGLGQGGQLYVLQHIPQIALRQQPQQKMQMGKWVSLLSLWATGCEKGKTARERGLGWGGPGRLRRESQVCSPSNQRWLLLCPGSGGL